MSRFFSSLRSKGGSGASPCRCKDGQLQTFLCSIFLSSVRCNSRSKATVFLVDTENPKSFHCSSLTVSVVPVAVQERAGQAQYRPAALKIPVWFQRRGPVSQASRGRVFRCERTPTWWSKHSAAHLHSLPFAPASSDVRTSLHWNGFCTVLQFWL